MGRDARSIIITKKPFDSEKLFILEKLIGESIEGEVRNNFTIYDLEFRNTCLTEKLAAGILENGEYILEADGHTHFSWKLWWSANRVSNYTIDTFYESAESIRKQIERIVKEVKSENPDELIELLAALLKTNEC